jgi:polysaccharide export outer membrane protein
MPAEPAVTFFCLVCSIIIRSVAALVRGDAFMQQRLIGVISLSLFIVTTILAASGIGARFTTPASAQAQVLPSAAPTDNPADSYVLGPNDRVRLKVYGEPDIAGEYEIDSTGQVSIPLAGHVKAAGLTTKQLERSIRSALSKGIVRDPRVNVEIALYRPYYILGEVKKGGEYPYRLGLTVMDAVASAGGFTYRANENKVYLRRSGAGVEETYALDAPVPVFPGDNIRIPERYF